MNLDKPRGHVVFDCDGTLISSEFGIYRAVSKLFSDYLNRPVTMEEVREKFVPDLRQLAENFGVKAHDDPKVQKEMIKRFQLMSARMGLSYDLFPGIKDLLLELGKANFLLYVWTGRDRKTTLEILKKLDVAKYFLDFRCVDDTTPKPHPQGIFELVGNDCPKDKVIVIGDSYTDIRGARSFGCQSIGCTWSEYANHGQLENEGADFIVNEPKDCLDIILKYK